MVSGTSARRWVAGLMAGAAVLSATLPAFADGCPTPEVGKHCVFSGKTPTPGSTVSTHDVFIAVTIACNKPVGQVSVFLDGVRRTTEGLGPDEFHTNEFFEALNLASGHHKVQVFVQDANSTSWTFRVR